MTTSTFSSQAVEFASRALPDVSVNHRAQHNAGDRVLAFVREAGVPVLFCAESAGRREVFGEFLTRIGLKTTDVLTGQYEAEAPLAPKFAEFEAYLSRTLEVPEVVEV